MTLKYSATCYKQKIAIFFTTNNIKLVEYLIIVLVLTQKQEMDKSEFVIKFVVIMVTVHIKMSLK